MKPIKQYLLAGLALVALAGCQAGSGIVTPDTAALGFGNFKMAGLSGLADFRLRVSNPNPDPIMLEGLNYVIYANGNSFAKGMAPVKEAVPAFGHVDVVIPSTISSFGLARTAISGAATKKVDYRLNVDITFTDAESNRRTRKAEKTGQLDVSFLDKQ
jgi:hypothetical protein